MADHTRRHDPAVEPEDEGIPDLSDGSPEAERASDPQRMPVPGDEPAAVDEYGTTVEEQIAGEPLDGRLAREEPEPAEPPAGGDVGGPDAVAEDEAGRLDEDPGRELPGRDQDVFAVEDAGAGHGLSAEESAVRVTREDERDLGEEPEEP